MGRTLLFVLGISLTMVSTADVRQNEGDQARPFNFPPSVLSSSPLQDKQEPSPVTTPEKKHPEKQSYEPAVSPNSPQEKDEQQPYSPFPARNTYSAQNYGRQPYYSSSNLNTYPPRENYGERSYDRYNALHANPPRERYGERSYYPEPARGPSRLPRTRYEEQPYSLVPAVDRSGRERYPSYEPRPNRDPYSRPEQRDYEKKSSSPVPERNPGEPSHSLCAREFLFIKFSTAAPVEEVKNAFARVTVIYSFKALFVNVYVFVVENDHSPYLTQLTLPPDATLTVHPFPIEPLATFFDRFGANLPAPDSFPDNTGQTVTLVDRIWDPKSANEQQYQAAMKAQAEEARAMIDATGVVGFVAVATYPTQFLLFFNRGDCEVAERVFKLSDNLGGPSATRATVLKLQVI